MTAIGLAWTGPDSYVVSRSESQGAAVESIGRLGSTAETPTASVPIAMEPDKPCIATDTNDAYTVWLGGKESRSEDGHAMACSADGSEVAVIKVSDGEGISGSLEVVCAATGSILWDLPGVELSGSSPVAFSSDGLHLLAGQSIVDLSSGSVASLPIASVESGAWLPDGRVGVIAVGDDHVRAFDVAGKESSIDLPSGRHVSVSPAGAIVLVDDVAGILRSSPMEPTGRSSPTAPRAHSCTGRPTGATSSPPATRRVRVSKRFGRGGVANRVAGGP